MKMNFSFLRFDTRSIAASLVVIGLASLLTACGKTIEFKEEVDIKDYSKATVVIERKQFYEKRNTQLQWIDVFVGAELRIVDTKLPAWNGELHPMFLGYTKELGFVLVTTMRNSSTCVRRGRPTSPYVAYGISESEWKEIKMPQQFDRMKANLLLAPRLNKGYSAQIPITMKDKDFPNQDYGLGTGLDVINLAQRYGC